MDTLLIISRLRFVVLPTDLSPFGKFVLRADGVHFSFKAEDFIAEAELFGGVFGGFEGNLLVEKP